MIDNTYDLLIESWKFKDKDSKVSLYDELSLRKLSNGSRLELKNFYATHLHPQPWWGNIENPEIIILAINPSYSHYFDDVEELEFGGFFRENITRKNDSLESWISKLKSFKVGNYKTKGTYMWWEKAFGKLITKEDGTPFNEKVGIFNLIGYRSKSKQYINKICYETKDFDQELVNFISHYNNVNSKVNNKRKYMNNLLPTQNALILHLNNIIKDNKVIVIWGIKDYIDIGLKVNDFYNNLLILNKYEDNNSSIEAYNNKFKINYPRKRDDCLDLNNSNYKDFEDYYELLLKILDKKNILNLTKI